MCKDMLLNIVWSNLWDAEHYPNFWIVNSSISCKWRWQLAKFDLIASQLLVCLRPNPWSWASQQSSGKQAAVPGPRSPGCIILWTWYSFRLKKKEIGSFIREQELLPRRHTWTPGWHSNEQMVHPGKKASVLLNPQNKSPTTFKMMMGCLAGFWSSRFVK